MNQDLPDLESLKRGEESAWDQAFIVLWRKAFPVTFHILENNQDAEEAASQALVELSRRISTIQNLDHLVATTLEASRARAIDLVRKKETQKRGGGQTIVSLEAMQEDSEGRFDVSAPDPPPGSCHWNDTDLDMLVLLHRLDERIRRLLYGRFIDGKTSAELAVEHGMREGAVRVAIYRGLAKLRAWKQGSQKK